MASHGRLKMLPVLRAQKSSKSNNGYKKDFHFLDASPFLNFEPPPGLGSEVVEVEAKSKKSKGFISFLVFWILKLFKNDSNSKLFWAPDLETIKKTIGIQSFFQFPTLKILKNDRNSKLFLIPDLEIIKKRWEF